MDDIDKDSGLLKGMEIADEGSDYPAKAAAEKVVSQISDKYGVDFDQPDDEEYRVKISLDDGPLVSMTIFAYVDHDIEIRITPLDDQKSAYKLIQNVVENDIDSVVDELFTWVSETLDSYS